MSVKDVTILRKEGRLKEAYDMALSELRDDESEWTRMSMFWVLKDLCKRDIAEGGIAEVKEELSFMADLLPGMHDDRGLGRNVMFWLLRDLCKRDIAEGDIEDAEVRLSSMADILPGMQDERGLGRNAFDYLLKQIQPNANEISAYSELSKTNATEAYLKAVEHFGKEAENLERKLHEDFAWILYRYMKEKASEFSSVQVRELLRDYMNLSNERPSMVHSMVLNFALNFAKEHSDFIFYKFLLMWGVNNLRKEDFDASYKVDHNIPSLVSRIIRVLVETDQKADWAELIHLLEENKDCISPADLLDLIRQHLFWILIHLQSEHNWDVLWNTFTKYAHDFSAYGPSHWHSEILKIAYRFMDGDEAFRFLPFVQEWNIDFLTPDDWKNEVGKDGKEYKSVAVKSAKKCFEIIKADRERKNMPQLIDWLKTFYHEVLEHDKDEWNVRNYATVCIWKQDFAEAIKMYKGLLSELSDKYYVWSELASCITDDNKLKIGLLLKARNIERNEDFIGDIHLDLAELWGAEGFCKIASKELDIYAENRKKNNWKFPARFDQLSKLVTAAKEETNDKPNFNAYIEEAENFAFDNYDWSNFVLVEKWMKDNVEHCSFIDGEGLSFSVKSKRFFNVCKAAKVGDVIKFRCRIEKKNKQTHIERPLQNETVLENEVIPLVSAKTDIKPWGILPVKYGVVDYDNSERKTLHVLTTDSKLAFYKYEVPSLKKGDFVKFRSYDKVKRDESVTIVVGVSRCSKEEALPNFRNCIAAVDDVNESKQLFHIVLGIGKIGDIVRYGDTDIRPSVGDFVKLVYCCKRNKKGEKHIVVLQIDTTEEANEMQKTIRGELRVNYGGDKIFAFIDDYYVHASVLDKCGICQNCSVIADIVYTSDRKWRVYNIRRDN
jgi:hypothetical protein